MQHNRNLPPFSLAALLGLNPAGHGTISFVGAGGKTSCLFALANELAAQGRRVAVSTTTHILPPDASQSAALVTNEDRTRIAAALQTQRLVTAAAPAENGKLAAPTPALLAYLADTADFLLLESDGSKRLPLKAPQAGEPALLSAPGLVVAVAGLESCGHPLELCCHRAPIAAQYLGVAKTHLVTPADIAALLWHFYSGCASQVVFLLNQADGGPARQAAAQIADDLIGRGAARAAVLSFFTGYAAAFSTPCIRRNSSPDR